VKQSRKSCAEYSVHEDIVGSIRAMMPEQETFRKAAEFFKALGDETRAKIIWALDKSEMCVCDLAETLGMTSSAVSHQLSFMRRMNLVKYRRSGKEVLYSLADGHVKDMLESCIVHTSENEREKSDEK
jgi:DNA-binding transcriptional ArsR family regulator